MESDRNVTSRSGERPVTRWRRESEKSQTYSERPESGVSRPYSKMERPTSRRGVKADISDHGISRPPTSRKSFSSRPPSAGILSNRASTPNSRIHTMSSANSARVGSGIPRSNMILNRPVTQQGLVGVRPSSSKSASRKARHSRDKEYYQQLLQLKVQELSKEAQEMTEKIEKLKSIYQDQKAEDLTNELIKVQSQLTHYSIVLNKLNSSSTNAEQHSKQFGEHSDHRTMDIGTIITKYHQAQDKLDDLNRQIQSKQKIGNLDLELKKKYDDALKEKLVLQQKVESLQIDYEQLSEISPANFMTNESTNGADGVSAENKRDTENNQMSELKQKPVDKMQEEIMDIFKSTFEKNRAEELEKLNSLEEQIAKRLEQISNNINESIDSSVLRPDEMEILNTLMDRNSENRSEKSFEELRQDNLKLSQISNKLEVIESKISNRIFEAKEKMELKQNLVSTDDLERKIEEFEDNNEESSSEREFLFGQESIQRTKDYTKLKEKVEQNELYRWISILEDKLKSVALESDQFNSSIEDSTEEMDHPSLMAKLLSLIARYNTFLINDIKSSYQTIMF